MVYIAVHCQMVGWSNFLEFRMLYVFIVLHGVYIAVRLSDGWLELHIVGRLLVARANGPCHIDKATGAELIVVL